MDDVDEKTTHRPPLGQARRLHHPGHDRNRSVKEFGGIDILIHSVAFSPEIKNKAIDTSRKALLDCPERQRLFADGPGSRALPFMENRPGGAVGVGLTYIGGDRSRASLRRRHVHRQGRAADRRQATGAATWAAKTSASTLISAGPYASRAARAIGDIEQMMKYAAERSPLHAPHHAGGSRQRRRSSCAARWPRRSPATCFTSIAATTSWVFDS